MKERRLSVDAMYMQCTRVSAISSLQLKLHSISIYCFGKHINLTNNQRVKVGTPTNARAIPADLN
jgi:hypothetical protein